MQSVTNLSIVVPLHEDSKSFESTLLSVLENQTTDTEIVVVHDGSYDDPFDLSDVVKFVRSTSDVLVDMIGTALSACTSDLVHILGAGFHATPDWTTPAVNSFAGHGIGAVAPVIRDRQRGNVITAGWSDGRRLMTAVGNGQKNISPAELTNVEGVFLQASFWRREILRKALVAASFRDMEATSYAIAKLCQTRGWSATVSPESIIHIEQGSLESSSSRSRGIRLGAIAQALDTNAYVPTLLDCLKSATKRDVFAEMRGRRSCQAQVRKVRAQIDIDLVPAFDSRLSISTASESSYRRAA